MGIGEISESLHDALYDGAGYGLLSDDGCGWLDGGCRSLMRALMSLLGDAAVPYQVVRSPEQKHSEHVLVRVGHWYLDGDGVSSEEELVRRWHEDEGFGTVVLRRFDPDREPPDENGRPGFLLNDEKVGRLARLIDDRVGRGVLLSLRG